MKNNKFYIKTAISLITIVFLAGCEQKQLERTSTLETKKDVLILSENNYIAQAKYHYARYLQIRQSKSESISKERTTLRAHPGAKLTRENNSNLISVKASSVDENIDTLLLSQNATRVKISLNKDSDIVSISFDSQKKSINEKMTFKEFENFNKGLENE